MRISWIPLLNLSAKLRACSKKVPHTLIPRLQESEPKTVILKEEEEQEMTPLKSIDKRVLSFAVVPFALRTTLQPWEWSLIPLKVQGFAN
jgi:hypothetical protein